MPEEIEPAEDNYDFELSKEDFIEGLMEILKEDQKKEDETA